MKSEDFKEGMILKSTVKSFGSYDCTLKVTEVKDFNFEFEILELGDKSTKFTYKGMKMVGSLRDIREGYYVPINRKVRGLS